MFTLVSEIDPYECVRKLLLQLETKIDNFFVTNSSSLVKDQVSFRNVELHDNENPVSQEHQKQTSNVESVYLSKLVNKHVWPEENTKSTELVRSIKHLHQLFSDQNARPNGTIKSMKRYNVNWSIYDDTPMSLWIVRFLPFNIHTNELDADGYDESKIYSLVFQSLMTLIKIVLRYRLAI